MSDNRTPNVLAGFRIERRRGKLPPQAVQLVQERFFIDARTLKAIQAELVELGHPRLDTSWLWQIARGRAYTHVQPSARLREWLRERNGGGKT